MAIFFLENLSEFEYIDNFFYIVNITTTTTTTTIR